MCSRINELNNAKTELKNKTDALRQLVSYIEEVKDEVKLKFKDLKEN